MSGQYSFVLEDGGGPSGLLHTCTVCGRESTWTADHQWYGSWLDLDGGRHRQHVAKPIIVTCSETCRVGATVKGLVPPDAELVSSE